ncbi:MAG TPA: F0F1 ATP synthase subunit alpha, partial [Phycisphaerae bacterium]|nr:F0F1 ATP synthase subunit alpha [Phycisphaerae bacterium]
MRFKVDEIASVIKEEIAQYRGEIDVAEVGRILEVGDGIARIYGLSNAMAGEMLEFENGTIGQVFNLEETAIGAVVLGDYLGLKEGDAVRGTGQLLSVPVGEALIGRVVDPLGRPLDGKGSIESPHRRPVETPAPGIAERQPVDQPLQTGIKAIDSMIPIGRGQRELIIGDRKTGKTAIGIDAILNQKGTGVICVYVAIGQKESTVAGVVQVLRDHGAMDYTIVVAAGSSDPAPLQYVAPYAGCAMAEYFMYEHGKDTLCVYDDLSKQAAAYRQLSLLL